MSIRAIAEVWESGPENHADLLVMLALADYADDQGRCWPSVASIAKKARMSERNARRVVTRLIDQGWLVADRSGGRNRASQYQLCVGRKADNLAPFPEKGGQPGSKRRTAGVEKADTAMAAEPSRSINEPSEGGAQARPPAPVDLLGNPSLPDEPKPKRKRAVGIDGWQHDPALAVMTAATELHGSTSTEARNDGSKVYQAFIDYARDKGRVSKDWNAAFRNWIAKEAVFRQKA